MKTKIFLTALFLSMIFFADSTAANNAPQGDDKKIDLQGSLAQGSTRSSGDPFEVFLSPYSIDISFLQDLRDITIEITDEWGETVYYNIVNPVSGQTLPISIIGWEEGIYTITFSDDTGGCIYGEFEIYE